MKVYDFSDCDFENEILNNKDTGIFFSKKFDYNGKEDSRVIISNPEENKRLVFFINSKKLIEQDNYSEEEKESIINYLESIKEELLESIE